MNRSLLWITVAYFALCLCEKYRQEQAQVTYSNPKYIGNVQAFTRRVRRGEPYKTNVTVTTLHPWGNNITAFISYQMRTTPPIVITTKICDAFKHRWMVDFFLQYIQIKLICPMPADTYTFINIELPPKNFPFPISKGTHFLNITSIITVTKEKILQITGKIYVN